MKFFSAHTSLRLLFVLLLVTSQQAFPYAQTAQANNYIIVTDQQAKALHFLDSVGHVDSSVYWANIDPALFFENLKGFAISPLKFYEGRGTNFCAYSALTYIPLKYDPLEFCQFMLDLYKNGRAVYRAVNFNPGRAIRHEAGQLQYKGALDINPAAQMWFLCLADRFKGYLNFFNRNFDRGDENTLWASTNYAKFNRMLRRLFGMKVHARGSDLIRPWIGDVYGYIKEQLQKGTVFLYLNNRLLYRKKHTAARFSIPTHFVLLLDIEKIDENKINITYWDYGLKSLQQVTPKFLRKIIFGITECHFPTDDE